MDKIIAGLIWTGTLALLTWSIPASIASIKYIISSKCEDE